MKAVSLGFRTKTTFSLLNFGFSSFLFLFFCQYARFYMWSGVGVGTFPNQCDVSCQRFGGCLQRSGIQTLGQKVRTFLKCPRFPPSLSGAPEISVSIRIEEHFVEKQVKLQFPRQHWNFQIPEFSLLPNFSKKEQFTGKRIKKWKHYSLHMYRLKDQ